MLVHVGCNVQSVYQIVTHDKITRNVVDIQNNEEEHHLHEKQC